MAVYIITGKLGGGKTLCAVGLIREALRAGRKVATNIDLNLDVLLPWANKSACVYRLADRLSAQQFIDIGIGNPDYNEEKNGLIVLDEGGLSMNSREYREEGRKEFIKWAIHSRKKGWDMAIIIQHLEGLDKQIRDFFGEHVVRCARWDRMRLPLVGGVLQWLGFKGTYSQLHQATCRYGQEASAMVTWKKRFMGKDLYSAYDTRQAYNPDDDSGVYQVLPPYFTHHRHSGKHDETKVKTAAMAKRVFHGRLGRVPVFFSAALFGGWVHAHYLSGGESRLERVATSALGIREAQAVGEGGEGVQAPGSENAVSLPPLDPWESARISGYVGNIATREFTYRFRGPDEAALPVPAGWRVVALSACAAILKGPDKQYHLFCRPPATPPAPRAGGVAEAVVVAEIGEG